MKGFLEKIGSCLLDSHESSGFPGFCDGHIFKLLVFPTTGLFSWQFDLRVGGMLRISYAVKVPFSGRASSSSRCYRKNHIESRKTWRCVESLLMKTKLQSGCVVKKVEPSVHCHA